MSEFVEECRREWKRLRVPDPVANEMAADLAADLREAEVEGASPEELLGDAAFDPQAFARSWAQERGLVGSLPLWGRLRLVLPLAAAAIVIGGGIAAAVLLTQAPSQSPTPPVVAPTATVGAPATTVVAIPNLVGMKRAEATAAARAAGLNVTIRYRNSGKGQSDFVVAQTPSPGASVPRGGTLSLLVQR